MRRGLILIFLFPILAIAEGKPAVDFAKEEQICANHWETFVRDEIPDLQRKVHDWMGGLNTRQVQTMYDANDELVLFTSNFFPSELAGRFTGPESFDECFGLNVKIQREMSDRSISHEEELKQYADCVSNRYDSGDLRKPIIKPLNRFLACYKSQARQLRN